MLLDDCKLLNGDVVKLAYTQRSGRCGRKPVGVQLSPSPPFDSPTPSTWYAPHGAYWRRVTHGLQTVQDIGGKVFNGTIIEESLEEKSVLDHIKILKTEVENVTEKHRTPWLKRWTLHEIEVPDDKADEVAGILSRDLEKEHTWYADFKDSKTHYIIFPGKVFHINRMATEYQKVRDYGVSIGIPEHQLDFSPDIN